MARLIINFYLSRVNAKRLNSVRTTIRGRKALLAASRSRTPAAAEGSSAGGKSKPIRDDHLRSHLARQHHHRHTAARMGRPTREVQLFNVFRAIVRAHKGRESIV